MASPIYRRLRSAAWMVVWVCCSLLMLVPIAYVAGVRIVVTPSVRMGAWWVHDFGLNRASIARGSYVTSCAPPAVGAFGRERQYIEPGNCPGGVMALVKRIVAVPGDRVEVSASGLRVNGVLQPRTQRFPTDTRGRKLPSVADGTYVVNEGEYWVVGDIARSWDSRYWGPIASVAVIGLATPLILTQ